MGFFSARRARILRRLRESTTNLFMTFEWMNAGQPMTQPTPDYSVACVLETLDVELAVSSRSGIRVVSTDRQGNSREKSAFSVCLDGADLARIDGSCRQEGR